MTPPPSPGPQSCDDARTLRVYGAAFSAFDESKVHRLATCVSMLVRHGCLSRPYSVAR